jgi:hypothetical protein
LLRGFSPKIKQITQGGSVGVRIYDVEGDPFGPLLFNFIFDVFSNILVKGSASGLIRGLCPHFIPVGDRKY